MSDTPKTARPENNYYLFLLQLVVAFAFAAALVKGFDSAKILVICALIVVIALGLKLVGLRKPLWVFDAIFIMDYAGGSRTYREIACCIAMVFIVDNLLARFLIFLNQRYIAQNKEKSVPEVKV